MTALNHPTAAQSGCQAYRVLRMLSMGGVIVSRESPLAQAAVIELGLSEIEKPSALHDRRLLEHTRQDGHRGAFLSLRCRVSWPLEQRLQVLHRQFSSRHGLELAELAAFALDDVGHPLAYQAAEGEDKRRSAEPFGVEVIRSYRPELSNLATWAKQKLLGHPPLKRYLEQQGVRLMGDWALLGDASHLEVRRAVEQLGGRISVERAAGLHRRYLDLYKPAKLDFRLRTGRQQGWFPDDAFLQQVCLEQEAEQTRRDLMEIATLVRRCASGRWERGDSALLDDEPASRWANQQADEDQARIDQLVLDLVERVGRACTDQLVAELRGDALVYSIWRAWSDGMNQRRIAQHCDTNQARVCRTLKLERHAGEIVTEILRQLRSQLAATPDAGWAAAFTSLNGLQDAERRLMNHLLHPEQQWDVAPLRRWVRQSLDSSTSLQRLEAGASRAEGSGSAPAAGDGSGTGGNP